LTAGVLDMSSTHCVVVEVVANGDPVS